MTITTITPNLVIMSHWTTSGRSRLKAKQSHGRSFSQKAQQRAAFVAAESDAAETQYMQFSLTSCH